MLVSGKPKFEFIKPGGLYSYQNYIRKHYLLLPFLIMQTTMVVGSIIVIRKHSPNFSIAVFVVGMLGLEIIVLLTLLLSRHINGKKKA
jgi:hypothetical protein